MRTSGLSRRNSCGLNRPYFRPRFVSSGLPAMTVDPRRAFVSAEAGMFFCSHGAATKRLLIAGAVLLACCFAPLSRSIAQSGMPGTWEKEQIRTIEDTLGILSYMIVNDSLQENRFAATRLMIPTLVQALKIENSFNYPFDRLKSVSIQYPQDSTFRIFTWQLFVDGEEYRYYGAIQMNTPELKLFPLIDRSHQIEDPAQAVLNAENWYGAVYYGIRNINTRTGPAYLLFGYDAFSFFNRRKLIDVLTFNEGKPEFGKAVFPATVGQPNASKRFILEYTAEASVKLNYDPLLDLVVFDHLIPVQARSGQGEIMAPDGSYEAFRIKKDGLEYIPMLETTKMATPPRPAPVLDQKGKDILGRVKKN
ncbi:MAG: hypothetical protein ACOYOO_10695 [Saprospiraceae bacterium]